MKYNKNVLKLQTTLFTEIQQANKFEFTSCGKTGRFGPTFEECAQHYREKNVKVGVKNGTQLWQCKRAGLCLNIFTIFCIFNRQFCAYSLHN